MTRKTADGEERRKDGEEDEVSEEEEDEEWAGPPCDFNPISATVEEEIDGNAVVVDEPSAGIKEVDRRRRRPTVHLPQDPPTPTPPPETPQTTINLAQHLTSSGSV